MTETAYQRRRYDGPTLYVDGNWRQASGTSTFDVIDPSTEAKLATLPAASAEETIAAIEAAEAAFVGWKRTSAQQRANHLQAIAQAVRERRTELAQCIALEIGKPMAQALSEVDSTCVNFEWYAAEAVRLRGQIIPARGEGCRTEIDFEPVGVAALLTPWNFPVALLARKLAPALAAGCTAVAKPAEEAALSALTFFDIVASTDLPAGVANLLLGRPSEISAEIMASSAVRKISFTGSVSVGQQLFAQSAPTLKRMSLELGGNAPVLIFDDVDARRLGKEAALRKISNAGQVCVAPNRYFVQSGVTEAFIESFVEAAHEIRIGNPFDGAVQMGPLATEKRRDAIESIVDTAIAQGAHCAAGGRRPPQMNSGYYYQPTVLTNVVDGMDILDTEIFGPVAPVVAFDTEDEVIDQANNTNLGLAAYAFTRDHGRLERLRENLSAGMIGLNSFVLGRIEAPFGGINYSGYGREGGAYGIMEYVHTKWSESVFATDPMDY